MVEFVAAVVTGAALLLISAPYGRHARSGFGPTVPARLAWILMEVPALLCFSVPFLMEATNQPGIHWLFFGGWFFHYSYRTFVFPFKLNIARRTTPFLIVVLAIIFNALNGSINAAWLKFYPTDLDSWETILRVILGSVLFTSGVRINHQSDAILMALRTDTSDTSYKIPHGGMYRYISCPNYFGELLEWSGWAIATGSLAGWAFVAFTASNLVPRALAHHRWYQEKFGDYPKDRKILLPFVW